GWKAWNDTHFSIVSLLHFDLHPDHKPTPPDHHQHPTSSQSLHDHHQHHHHHHHQCRPHETEIYMCTTVKHMVKLIKRISQLTREYPGPMIKTRRLVLNLPSANVNKEMEMALNCDGDY
ncbi:hypothetical protein Ahia01_000997800, partial [Argonauta hians]